MHHLFFFLPVCDHCSWCDIQSCVVFLLGARPLCEDCAYLCINNTQLAANMAIHMVAYGPIHSSMVLHRTTGYMYLQPALKSGPAQREVGL